MGMHLILVKPARRKQPNLCVRSRERGNSKRLPKNSPHLIAVHASGHMTHANRRRKIRRNTSVGREVLLSPVSGTRPMRRSSATGRYQCERDQDTPANEPSHTLDHILFSYINN